jgi:mannose-6-phosphate isomerase-like protein (cupin superfamily)
LCIEPAFRKVIFCARRNSKLKIIALKHSCKVYLDICIFGNTKLYPIKTPIMLTSNQTLDMSPIGMIFHIVKTPRQTNGRSLEMEWEVLPKADGTPLHIHPSAKESYKVTEGQLEINIGGKWKLLQQGEELTVPEGTPHTFRNTTDHITRVYNTHSPAMRYDEYFEGLNSIVSRLSRGSKEQLKINFNSATHLSMLMKKYKEEIVSVNPPNFIVSVLNRIGKLKGLKV